MMAGGQSVTSKGLVGTNFLLHSKFKILSATMGDQGFRESICSMVRLVSWLDQTNFMLHVEGNTLITPHISSVAMLWDLIIHYSNINYA